MHQLSFQNNYNFKMFVLCAGIKRQVSMFNSFLNQMQFSVKKYNKKSKIQWVECLLWLL
jgi:hypothetical protein